MRGRAPGDPRSRRHAPPPARAGPDEVGTTLVETVAATAVLGIALVALVGLAGTFEAVVGSSARPEHGAEGPPAAEALGRIVRPTQDLIVAGHRAATLDAPSGRLTVVVTASGAVNVTGPAATEERIALDALADRLAYLTDHGERLEPGPLLALTAGERAAVTAVVVVDAAGRDLVVVAFRDRGRV